MNIASPNTSYSDQPSTVRSFGMRFWITLGIFLSIFSGSTFVAVSQFSPSAATQIASSDNNPAVLGVTSPDSTLSMDAPLITKDEFGNYLFPMGSVNVVTKFATGSQNKVESVEAIVHYDPSILSAESVNFNQPLSTQYLTQDALGCNPVYVQRDESGQETGAIRIARTVIPLPQECPPAEPGSDPLGAIFPSYNPIPINTSGSLAVISFKTLQTSTTPYQISYEYQPTYLNPIDMLNDSNASAYIEPAERVGQAYDTLSQVSNLSFLVGPQPEPVDEVPPTVDLLAPVSGAVLSGSVDLTANAADDKAIANVDFLVDGAVVCSKTNEPYTCALDTTKYSSGSTHSIEVQAFDTATPPNSAVDSITVSVCNGDCAPPTAPTNLKVTQNLYNAVALSWTASSDDIGVAGYYVYSKKAAESKYTQIGSTTTAAFTDTSVSGLTTYSYYVKAFDAADSFSPASNIVDVTTPQAPDVTPPSAPTLLTASVISTSQINLNWQASTDSGSGTGIAGYNIYRKRVDLGDYTKVNASVVTGTNYGDSGLLSSTQYMYYVTALDKAGNESAQSTVVIATTLGDVIAKGNIVGTVISAQTKKPLANVKVTIVVGKDKKTTTTDINGTYSFINLAPSVYSVGFRSTSYITQLISVKVVNGKTEVLDISLKAK